MATKFETKYLLAAIATGVALTFGGVALADGHGHGKRHGGHAFAELDLTDEQRTAIRQLMRDHREQGRADRTAMREGIREILTDEQVAQLEAKRAERAERGERGERRGPRGDRHRGHRS